MANSGKNEKNEEDKPAGYSVKEEVESFISTLPTVRSLPADLYEYQGYWLLKQFLTGMLISRKYFKAQSSNVFIASQPKCGTTWLKALVFTIMNRNRFDFATHPLLSSNPHDCVDFLEFYANLNPLTPNPTNPLIATHIPYQLLPDSILQSPCPILYIARDPKDVFVSRWLFVCKLAPNEASSTSLEEQFDMFCKGMSNSGPCWEHMLGYWKASLEFPNKIMFMRYEKMKSETYTHVKKMAEFIGLPFSRDEENDGIVQKVIDLCSLDNLKNLEVNQGEVFNPNSARFNFMNDPFFRKGKVGDHKNFLNEEMIKRIDDITEMKFKGSGLVVLN